MSAPQHHPKEVAPNRLPELVTPSEVATWLRTTVGAVYAKAERGSLPGATRVGRRLYFVASELRAHIERGRIASNKGLGESG